MAALQAEPLRVLAALVVIAAAARLGALLARPAGQPQVVGEIAAGIALGPSLFGLVAPGALAALFPPAVRADLDLLARAGIVLFMFSVGREFDRTILRGHSRLVLTLSHANVVVPLALGTAGAMLLQTQLGGDGISTVPFALFVGVSLAVTAFPVLARIVEDAGLAEKRLGTTALACAGVTDAVAWSLLLVVAALAGASGLRQGGTRIALVALLVLAVFGVVRPILARASEHLRKPGAATLVGVGVAFALATATQELGVHAFLGAFLGGLVAPRRGPGRDKVWKALDGVNRAALLPVFFASIGLGLDLGRVASTPPLVAAGLVMLVLAVAGKLGATALASRAAGLEWRESLALGLLMNTKGITEIVVLKTGLDLGLINEGAASVLIVVALLTTALALPALRVLDVVADRPRVEPALRLRAVEAMRRLTGASAP